MVLQVRRAGCWPFLHDLADGTGHWMVVLWGIIDGVQELAGAVCADEFITQYPYGTAKKRLCNTGSAQVWSSLDMITTPTTDCLGKKSINAVKASMQLCAGTLGSRI